MLLNFLNKPLFWVLPTSYKVRVCKGEKKGQFLCSAFFMEQGGGHLGLCVPLRILD